MLAEIDRARWRRERADGLATRLDVVRARMRALDGGGGDPLADRVGELRGRVDDGAPRAWDDRQSWIAFRQRVQPSYEALAATLRASSVHVPSLRPTNYTRNVFHVMSAGLGVALVELAPAQIAIAVAIAVAAIGWGMEASRRVSTRANSALMKLFGPVAHPHEAHRINSATWYVTALVMLSLTEARVACALALVALGLGDPAAAIVGRRWGRHKIVNGRSVEGSLAFVAAAAIGGAALLALGLGLALGPAILVAIAAGATGAFAELVSRHVDDNLSVPVLAWCGAAIALVAIGVGV